MSKSTAYINYDNGALNSTISIEPREKYLYVSICGPFELRTAKKFSNRIFDACAKYGLTKIIVDCRAVTGPISLMDKFDYFEYTCVKHLEYLNKGKNKPVNSAYVLNKSMFDKENFGTTVAANRGLNVKGTTDVDEALRWLGLEPADMSEDDD